MEQRIVDVSAIIVSLNSKRFLRDGLRARWLVMLMRKEVTC